MKFFIPGTEGNKQLEKQTYESVRKFVSQEMKKDLCDTKIYEIKFGYGRKEYLATVGEAAKFNGEIVIAIFETDNMYFICTPSRGVVRGNPVMVGKNDIISIEAFQ